MKDTRAVAYQDPKIEMVERWVSTIDSVSFIIRTTIRLLTIKEIFY